MASAFLMIFTGYLGGVVLGDGNSLAGLWTWGIISGVFMVVLYVVFIYVGTKSTGEMTSESARTLKLAVTLQLVVFFAYPIIFGFQGYSAKDGAWTVAAQVTLSLADIAAKVGLGSLVHKLAKLRTAEDIIKGEETHLESVWVSSSKKADAVLPPQKHDSSSRHSDDTGRQNPDDLVVADVITAPPAAHNPRKIR